ncbi:hypothetical protein KSS87_014760 [Heliosperma pusillum]|nr:hypothetical protein KSS87_014760 [Heliosperma pusillum]
MVFWVGALRFAYVHMQDNFLFDENVLLLFLAPLEFSGSWVYHFPCNRPTDAHILPCSRYSISSSVQGQASKYEYMVLLDLIKKGHSEPDKKIGSGLNAFEIRYHPTFQSRCLFVIRDDQDSAVTKAEKEVVVVVVEEEVAVAGDGMTSPEGVSGSQKCSSTVEDRFMG